MIIPAALLASAVIAVVILERGWRAEKMVASGDLMPGITSNPPAPWHELQLAACPGGQGYYTTELKTRFRRRPTDAEIKGLLGNPPPANVDNVFPCPGDCVNVLTHIWHSWLLTRNQLGLRWHLHVLTFAQYECMSPDDPTAKKPAVVGHPLDPTRPPMA